MAKAVSRKLIPKFWLYVGRNECHVECASLERKRAALSKSNLGIKPYTYVYTTSNNNSPSRIKDEKMNIFNEKECVA
jgi:hypothetical protein